MTKKSSETTRRDVLASIFQVTGATAVAATAAPLVVKACITAASIVPGVVIASMEVK